MKTAHTSTPSLYKNDKDLPIFECGRKERYTVTEAVEILLCEFEEEMKCNKTPLKVRKNLSFLVDVGKFKCWQDMKSDMNGVFSHTLRICTWTVEVDEENEVHSLEKKIALTGQNMYHIYINSMRNKAGLCRSIFFLRGQDEEILNSICLLQYTIAKEVQSTEVVYDVPSHGNRKGKRKPYYPTEKNTIQAIKDELGCNSAAMAFRNVAVSAGGALGARDPGELPRSRKQVYDLKNKMKSR